MISIPKNIKTLKPLFDHKHGDKIYYKTPHGNIKILVYGVQTWYNRCTPKRVIVTLRGNKWFREPNLTELTYHALNSRGKELVSAITGENPLLAAFRRHGAIKQYDGGATILPTKTNDRLEDHTKKG